MKHLILLATGLVFSFNLFAQPIGNILSEIEKNNTTLSALRKNIDAEEIGNRTGIYLQNPEAGFNYLWGNPSTIGNRTDFSVKQSFYFPTVYGYKSQIANLKNEQGELEYQKQQKAILSEARSVLADLAYLNARRSELSKREAHAGQIAGSYQAKYDAGEANILEYDKSQLNRLTLNKEIETAEIERKALLSRLAILNGGIPVNFTAKSLPDETILPDFEEWYAFAEKNNPVLQWLKQEIAISQKQMNLQSAMVLPKIDAGYMSEKVTGEQFQGITIGVSIPLWENKNTVKYAKAKTLAVQSMEADVKLQFYNEMKVIHAKVVALQSSIAEYKKSLLAFSHSDLLKKALDKGEISLSEYLYELSVYYTSTDKLLEMERDLNKAIAELNRFQ
jgi:cobalt-zinc-cadmium efflux system outer membrane protein